MGPCLSELPSVFLCPVTSRTDQVGIHRLFTIANDHQLVIIDNHGMMCNGYWPVETSSSKEAAAMNAKRRKELQAINDRLEGIREELEAIRDAEQEAFDAMPEYLQSSALGEQAQDAISYMEDAIAEMEASYGSILSALEV